MNVVPFVHEGLGNSSYLVELRDGTAVLVDPDRTVRRYLRAAEARGWRIVAVFETHLHADFVSGAPEAAAATGAQIFGAGAARCRFPYQGLQPNERVRLDGAEVEAVGSPGHTPEHLSYVFRTGGRPPALFSGGSLIVGGAARTDLISAALTDELTRAQYRTLSAAFRALPDETLVLPTHGGGSFCSAGSGEARSSTLGRERAENPALKFPEVEEFVRWFPTTFPNVPTYFTRMRAINQAGARLRQEIPSPRALLPDGFEAAARDALIVDVRPKEAYLEEHIPGSLSISFRDSYATWLGWLVPLETPLLFIAGDVPVERLVDESLLVGFERFAGRLEGGIAAWTAAGKSVASAALVDARGASEAVAAGATVVDVREPAEFAAGHIPGAVNLPLGVLGARLESLAEDRPIVACCAVGDRASTAVSVLERAGREQLADLDGGIEAWISAGYEVAV